MYLGSRRIAPIINKKYKADISARANRRFQNNQGFTYGKDTLKPTLTDKMKKIDWSGLKGTGRTISEDISFLIVRFSELELQVCDIDGVVQPK